MVDVEDRFRNGPPWAGPPATLFIDSNVIHEFTTHVDLSRATDRLLSAPLEQRPDLGARGIEIARRVQGTYWMAMALDHEERVTLQLGPEVLPWTLRNAPPGSKEGQWVSFMAHYAGNIVARWLRSSERTRRGGRDANDTQIVEVCRERGLPIISRDEETLRPKAGAAGVSFLSPEQYASSTGLSLDAARSRFFERFDLHVPGWIERFLLQPEWTAKTAREAFAYVRIHLWHIWTIE